MTTRVSLPPLPNKLFRFRTFGALGRGGSDKTTVFSMLAGKLPFARIEDFNDPFEGRPLAVPAFRDAGRQRAAVLTYVRTLYRQRGVSPGEANRRAKGFIAGKTMQQIVEEIGGLMRGAHLSDGLLLCCFSGEEGTRAPITWSHYADSHRGVCLHYDTTKFPVKLALAVEYDATYPEVKVPRTAQSDWEAMQKTFLRKSHHWSYENEYRVMKVEFDLAVKHPRLADLFVKWKGAVALASADVVSGITIGARMPPAERKELLGHIAAHHPGLNVWEARLHRSRYEIEEHKVW
jgi:hypothetical protein